MITAPFHLMNEIAVRRSDDRGYLDVLYERDELVLKRSFSHAGVFRGMHWQRPPREQTKLIRVVSGRILDFVLDPMLPVPKVYYREIVSADGWIRIDAHLAHGFYAYDDTVFEYLCHGAYDEASEAGFSIQQFLTSVIGLGAVTLSAKDRAAAPLHVVDGNKNC